MNKDTKKINIGLFIDTFYPMIDGVVVVVDNYAKRLAKYANVYVFAPGLNDGYDDTRFNYKVIRCKSFKVPFLDYSLAITSKKFKKQLEEYNLDIVHIHSPATIGKCGIKYAKRHNVVSIGTIHSQFKQDFKRAVKFSFLVNILVKKIRKFFDKCDYVWTVNDKISEVFKSEYGYNKKTKTMRNATEFLPIKNKKDAIDFINSKYNIDNSYKVFLFVGRINLLKNVDFIIRSLKILKEKQPDFKYKMLFVGSGQDEEILNKLIKECNLSNDVIMCGRVTDRLELALYYKRADLFLFPSLYDTSSLVQVEAASQETPTVFIKGSVTSSTVTNNINGYLVENNEEAFALKIIEIFSDLGKYKKVCKNAFRDLYISWDDSVNIVYKEYMECIKRNGKK